LTGTAAVGTSPVTIFLSGDVMLGRGVDQILPHPGDPTLRERHLRDARAYVELAEAAHGPVPRPADFSWPWGEALAVLDASAPDARVVNLETSVTRSDEFAPGKAVHYRMSPANLPGLAVVRPDVCVLANNHVLDFGRPGLAETLDVLAGSGLRAAGAGRDAAQAAQPAVVPVGNGRRVLVLSLGAASSGIPASWAATGDRAGVRFVADLSGAAAADVTAQVQRLRRPGDVVVASVHWGSNWGWHVPADQVDFAHRLVDGGVDVVHGHSSHHPRPFEVYRGRLVLYGCGDLVNDYEGISGYEGYRDDLRLLHLATIEPGSGSLAGLRMVPLQAHRMRLRHASRTDAEWLRSALDRAGRRHGTRVGIGADGVLLVE
jgi:poly-gamma-glutamate capsule biosynthesis protein CapA/YwtB (metallophosphatase superfamily)